MNQFLDDIFKKAESYTNEPKPQDVVKMDISDGLNWCPAEALKRSSLLLSGSVLAASK